MQNYTSEGIKQFQRSPTCIFCVMYSVTICFYLHFLIICSAHSLSISTHFSPPSVDKLSYNSGSTVSFRNTTRFPTLAQMHNIHQQQTRQASQGRLPPSPFCSLSKWQQQFHICLRAGAVSILHFVTPPFNCPSLLL